MARTVMTSAHRAIRGDKRKNIIDEVDAIGAAGMLRNVMSGIDRPVIIIPIPVRSRVDRHQDIRRAMFAGFDGEYGKYCKRNQSS